MNMRGMTLIRTIISVSAFSTTVAGAWGVQTVDIGIGVASQEAFAALVLPDPSSPVDKPPRGWIWKTNRIVSQNGAGGQVAYFIEADIRGARKVENGEVYVIVDNNFVTGTSFTVTLRGLIRTLYKL